MVDSVISREGVNETLIGLVAPLDDLASLPTGAVIPQASFELARQ